MVTRRSRDELRTLVLDSAVELLHQSAPTITVDSLSYQAVFNHLAESHGVKVTHASVHERIWSSQRDFQIEALAEAIRQVPNENHKQFADAALASLPLDTSQDRDYASQEITRLAMNSNWEGAAGGYELLRVLRLLVTLDSPSGLAASNDQRVIDLVTGSRRATTDLYATMVRELANTVGMRLRPNLGMDLDEVAEFLATTANATVTGLEIDRAVMDDVVHRLPTGRNGELQDWYPVALATWALVTLVFDIGTDRLNHTPS